MKNKKLIIIGGEGNGGVIASCIDDHRKNYNDFEWEVVGFLNDSKKFKTIYDLPVLGGTDMIDKYLQKEDYYFMFAIHMVGRNKQSEAIFNKLNIPPQRLATIVHKTAFVAPNVKLDAGVFVMSNAYIGHSTHIGKCTLIMANAIVGHNVTIGDLCHISVGAVIGGYVFIGNVADVTFNATILAGIKIGDYAVAGANALITKNIPNDEVHIGTPGKLLKKTE